MATPAGSPAALPLSAATVPAGWLSTQLERLRRLLVLQRTHSCHLNTAGQRLLRHAIFATYVECRGLAGERLAAGILARHTAAAARPARGSGRV